MEQLIAGPNELRERGFQALADALGWANAVRFLRQYDAGSANYTQERQSLLPDETLEALAAEIERIQKQAKV